MYVITKDFLSRNNNKNLVLKISRMKEEFTYAKSGVDISKIKKAHKSRGVIIQDTEPLAILMRSSLPQNIS